MPPKEILFPPFFVTSDIIDGRSNWLYRLVKSGHISPSIKGPSGRGKTYLWSYEDLAVIWIIKTLTALGLSIELASRTGNLSRKSDLMGKPDQMTFFYSKEDGEWWVHEDDTEEHERKSILTLTVNMKEFYDIMEDILDNYSLTGESHLS